MACLKPLKLKQKSTACVKYWLNKEVKPADWLNKEVKPADVMGLHIWYIFQPACVLASDPL